MSNVVKFTSAKEQENQLTKQGLSDISKILSDQFANNNVKSIIAIVYYKDDEEDTVNYYLAGECGNTRELVGDIEIFKDAVLCGEI